MELGGRAARELVAQRVEHFLPCQTAAVDHAIGGLELTEFAARESGSAKSNLVEAYNHRGATVERNERWNITDNTRQAADHGQPTDAAELVDGHRSGNVCLCSDIDVAAEH